MKEQGQALGPGVSDSRRELVSKQHEPMTQFNDECICGNVWPCPVDLGRQLAEAQGKLDVMQKRYQRSTGMETARTLAIDLDRILKEEK